MQSAIIVHGGAGEWKEGGRRMKPAIEACREATHKGQQSLLQGASALDAVEVATRILEDSPVLDAGRGSYPTRSGTVEMDALIMDGETLRLGAVGAIELVRNPISLARRIMEECEHTFLVGRGASDFAEEIGFPRCLLEDLLTESHKDAQQEPMGTVGAVARDRQGNLAAAVSTGGTASKRSGRLGDSPLVGSGAYADNWTAAAVATGYGEALMKVVISHRTCDFVGAGLTAEGACQAAIQLLAQRVQGSGGIIAIDARGNVGHAYNTRAMPIAFARGDGPVQSSS